MKFTVRFWGRDGTSSWEHILVVGAKIQLGKYFHKEVREMKAAHSPGVRVVPTAESARPAHT